MIDRAQRAIARSIAGGCPVEHGTVPVKTEAYGTFARLVLARISLDAVAKDMKEFRGKSVSGVMEAFSDSMFGHGTDVLHKMSFKDQKHLSSLFNARMDPSPAITIGRLSNGLTLLPEHMSERFAPLLTVLNAEKQ